MLNLIRIAKIKKRSKSFLVRQAIELYLADDMDCRTAADRLNDREEMVLNPRQLRKRLGE